MNFYFNLKAKSVQKILTRHGYICMTFRKFLYKCGWTRAEVDDFTSRRVASFGVCWKKDEDFAEVKNCFLTLYTTSDKVNDMWYFWARYDPFLLKHSQQVIIKQLIRKKICEII